MGVAICCVPRWGWIGVGATEQGIAQVVLPCPDRVAVAHRLAPFADRTAMALADQCAFLLQRYLCGDAVDLAVVPIDWRVVAAAHKPILQTLQRTVPLGQTITYGELARRCGVPRGARLVGQAMAKNPVPLLVPCHRVVRADGTLGGFGGGLALKARLLALERAIATRGKGDSGCCLRSAFQ